MRLRYSLQWAQIRRSTGRILWFAFVQGLMALAAVLFAIFGLGSLIVAVRLGRGESMAQIVLAVVYVNALLSSVVFGYGLNQAFSDRSLRRYPFSFRQRFIIRHLLGLFEPLWLVTAAGYLGAAAGATLLGAAPIWVTVPTAAILMTSNYLAARLILGVGSYLLETTVGSLLLVASTQFLFMMPMASQFLLRDPGRRARVIYALGFTPPLTAGSLLTGAGRLSDTVTLLGWCAVTVTIVVLLDRRPEVTRSAGGAQASWHGPLDRIAAFFPGEWAPLVARALRFYLRNQQVRLSLLTMFLFLTVWPQFSRVSAGNEEGLFEMTVLMSALLGSATSALSNNPFGFEGSGARRLLLAPTPALTLLGASNVASMLVCALYIVVVTGLWMAFASWGADPRMPLMLMTHALTGMFVFHAIAVWSSVVAPARGDYFEKFRRQASGGSQMLVWLFLVFVGVSFFVRRLLLPGPLVGYWWLSMLVMCIAAGVFAGSLWMTAGVLPRRRERLLSIIEGRT